MARGTETGRARCVGRSLLADAIAPTDAVARQFQLQMIQVRAATEADRDAIWNIFHEIIASGDTFAFDPKMSREEALAIGFEQIRILTWQKKMAALSALTSCGPTKLGAARTLPTPLSWLHRMHRAPE